MFICNNQFLNFYSFFLSMISWKMNCYPGTQKSTCLTWYYPRTWLSPTTFPVTFYMGNFFPLKFERPKYWQKQCNYRFVNVYQQNIFLIMCNQYTFEYIETSHGRKIYINYPWWSSNAHWQLSTIPGSKQHHIEISNKQ